MSREYDTYLEVHRQSVAKGFYWIREHLPELLIDVPGVSYEHQICYGHDLSKCEPDEYDAYDAYFYGNNRSAEVVENYKYAWLRHLNRNPHHWQHWILINDDPKEGEVILDMPYNYIVEMICDWWAFSWRSGNLKEIFKWYSDHSAYMKLSEKTRNTVSDILSKISEKLEVSND